jgi:TRAP-type C4-dicarboxylate transport system permease small subunit
MLSRIEIEAIHTNKGLGKIGKLIDKLSDFSGMLSGIFLMACALIVFWQVIARRIFHQPTSWEPDITVYLLIWIGFLASGFGLKEGSHVIIDTVVDLMTPRVRAALDLCAYFLTAVYGFIFTIYSIRMTIGSFRIGETAYTELRIPIGPVKLGLAVGMFILTLQALRMFISKSHTFHEESSNLKMGKGVLNSPLFVVIIFAAILVFQ